VHSGTVRQTGKIVGGTGRFAAATGRYSATVKARVLLARDRDGSCSFRRVERHEVGKIAASGTCHFDDIPAQPPPPGTAQARMTCRYRLWPTNPPRPPDNQDAQPSRKAAEALQAHRLSRSASD
jgi:hypothetical protein